MGNVIDFPKREKSIGGNPSVIIPLTHNTGIKVQALFPNGTGGGVGPNYINIRTITSQIVHSPYSMGCVIVTNFYLSKISLQELQNILNNASIDEVRESPKYYAAVLDEYDRRRAVMIS